MNAIKEVKAKKASKVTIDIASANRIFITPDQYNALAFTGKNRGVKPAHVKKMKESVLRNGVLRFVIVVWNNLLNKFVIVDGQHLTRALQGLNRNIECVKVDCETEDDMVQLMIDLNNTSKSWTLLDYIHSYTEAGNRHYKALSVESQKSDIQLSVFIQAYTLKRRSIATKMIKDGSFEIVDKKRGDQLIGYIKDCKNFTPNTRPMNEALIQLMLTIGNYNHKQMLINLKTLYKVTHFSTNEGELFKQLVAIYNI